MPKTSNPTYGAYFAWSGDDPTLNLINGATTTAPGVDATNSDGHYRDMATTTTVRSFSSSLPPSGSYCLAAKLVFPTASLSFTVLTRTSSAGSGGFRLQTQTTGGGIYVSVINTGSGSGSNCILSTGAFTNAPYAFVANYNGTVLKSYFKKVTDAALTTYTQSDTIGYTTASGSVMEIGDIQNGNAVQDIMVGPALSDANALALVNDLSLLYSAGVTARLFRTSQSNGLSGLGSSGPFFKNPL